MPDIFDASQASNQRSASQPQPVHRSPAPEVVQPQPLRPQPLQPVQFVQTPHVAQAVAPELAPAYPEVQPAAQPFTAPPEAYSAVNQEFNNQPPLTVPFAAETAHNGADIDMGTTDPSADSINPRKGKHVDEYSSVMRNEHASNNALKSYVPKPSKISFDSQQADEQVLLLLRRHPVTQVKWIVVVILLAFVPFLLGSVGLFNFIPLRFQFATMIGWYLLLIGFALESFLTWFFNVYLVTDERIVDVDFQNLLYKNISTAKIENIEDISAEAGGIVASVFNYGTVRIQTAGTAPEFEFEDVPMPAKVTAFLNEMLLEEEQEEIEGRVR